MAWTYEEKFNSLSDGNLDGQDSWTAAAGAANCTVQTTEKYEGAKGVYLNGSTALRRTITAVSSGVFYFAMRCKTSFTSADGVNFSARDVGGATYAFVVKFAWVSGALKLQYYSNGSYTTLASASVDTWYVIGIDYDGANNRYKIRLDTGAWSSYLTTGSSGNTQIDRIELAQDSSWQGYFDTITPSDPFSTAYTKDLNETVTLVDGTVKETGKVLIETVTLVDGISKTINKNLSEVTTLVDTISTSFLLSRTLGETINLEETGSQKITAKIIDETITTVDGILRDVSKVLNDAVVLVDTQNVVITFVKDISENLTLVDTISKQISKDLSEVISMVESMTNQKQYGRTFDEVTTLVDAVINTSQKVLNDALTLVDTISKTSVFGRSLSENITLVERFQGLLNGLDIKWIRKYANQAGTFIKKYLEIP
jgi:hypothetical protein